MWLVLTEPDDASGEWLAAGLQSRLPGAVVHVTSHDLAEAARGAHAFDGAGRWFRFETPAGRVVESQQVRGILNRICALPPGLALRLSAVDRAAAVRNFSLSLLGSLHTFAGPVINRPSAQGLSGDFRLPLEWSSLAEHAGLRPIPEEAVWYALRHSSQRRSSALGASHLSFAVIGSRVTPLDCSGRHPPPAIADACRRLAELARTSLLGVDLLPVTSDDWRFAGAHVRPDLTRGGAPILDAIAGTLLSPPPQVANPPTPGAAMSQPAGRSETILHAS